MAEGGVTPALFRRYPELAERIPWVPLGSFPTPVEPLRLERFGEGHWVKRDDLSGTRYVGNKVRKLEFLLAEARRRGAERLITVGAAGSHHALATAVYGTQLGFRVTLVLFPQPLTPHVRQVLLQDQALGAELRYIGRMEMIPAALLAAQLAHRDERCFTIDAGGSDPVGTLGYVSGALELAEQIEAGEAPRPEAVHLAMGTMGTAAGLAIGFSLAGLPISIHATRITSRIVTNSWALRRLVTRTLRLLEGAGLEPRSADEVLRRINVSHRRIGRGYGHETADGRRAAEYLNSIGLALDPTYTAKAAVDLLDSLERDARAPHLFWNTLSATCPVDHAALEGTADRLPRAFRRYLSRYANRTAERTPSSS
ncbi:pyridoxal-phosphate dependent enzyme [soil metagenome]